MELSKRNGFFNLVRLAVLALTVAAVVKELRKPADEREWHGSVGPVPYEFRRPTMERLRSRLWSPDASIIQPHPFGVGWTVNLGGVVGRVLASRGSSET